MFRKLQKFPIHRQQTTTERAILLTINKIARFLFLETPQYFC